MRLALTVTIGLTLTGVLAGAVPGTAASAPSAPRPRAALSAPPLAAYESQHLTWGPCPAGQQDLVAAGAQCTEVTVPLDYAAPRGRTIRVAVSRVKAAPGAHRRGILLSNPGGPGGTGLSTTLALRPALKDVADRYDLIGFDPRFLGESTPLRCAAPAPRPPVPSGTPSSARADFDESVAAARDTARRCHAEGDNAALLPHASTRNVARDVDVIRAALGERVLSYYGVSYGADLGAVYAQLFPRRVDRMVIDSSTDPSDTQYELFRSSGRPAEQGLDEWAAWAAARHGTYRLGRTPREVRHTVEGLLDRAERRPFAVDGQRVGAPVLRMILKQFVQHGEYDAALADLSVELVDVAAGRPAGPQLKQMIAMLASPELESGMTGGAIFMCGDGGWPAGGWPADPETYWKNSRRSRATQPVFGPFVNGMIAPCAFWESAPREPGTRIGNDVPVLMLQARRDNNVPYEGAVALHRRLTGSRLVTADIRSHGVYGRGTDPRLRPVPCADRAVNDYLRGGALPARDVVCAP
ncbi:alpha/beta hydrolase [Streptomyces sp. NPDC050504]|uniref:alpha/beta hydrolase n=1 Tax=Streptomyces sp. NPDC050504 TaxID=3365618 RepID=UPI0037AFF28D